MRIQDSRGGPVRQGTIHLAALDRTAGVADGEAPFPGVVGRLVRRLRAGHRLDQLEPPHRAELHVLGGVPEDPARAVGPGASSTSTATPGSEGSLEPTPGLSSIPGQRRYHGALGEVMISQRLVQMIEAHADELTGRWLKEVRQSKATPGYHALSDATLYQRAFDVYARLGRWVGSEGRREEVERTYTALGEERFREGLKLSEVVQALAMTKYQLWAYIRDYGLLDSTVQLYQSLELYNSVVLFFDRATYHTIVGYECASGATKRKAG
jgi:hypothetical protein